MREGIFFISCPIKQYFNDIKLIYLLLNEKKLLSLFFLMGQVGTYVITISKFIFSIFYYVRMTPRVSSVRTFSLRGSVHLRI